MTGALLELVETYTVSAVSGHDRLTGWKAVPVAGIKQTELVTETVRHAILPPMLAAALKARGRDSVLVLRHRGTMTRYFMGIR
jgi:hypothetical protein